MGKRIGDETEPAESRTDFEAMLAAVIRTDHLVREARAARHSARRKKHFDTERRRRRWWKGRQNAD